MFKPMTRTSAAFIETRGYRASSLLRRQPTASRLCCTSCSSSPSTSSSSSRPVTCSSARYATSSIRTGRSKALPQSLTPSAPSLSLRCLSTSSRQLKQTSASDTTSSINSSSHHQDATDARQEREETSTLELAHAEFIANAGRKSKFEIDGSEGDGGRSSSSSGSDAVQVNNNDNNINDKEGKGRSTASYRGHHEGGIDGQGKDREEVEARKVAEQAAGGREASDETGGHSHVGRLSPTSSHLFKLVLPLPRELPTSSSTSSSSPGTLNTPIETAFLLHPSQPLSHVSRLILGSLSPFDRSAQVEFRALADIRGNDKKKTLKSDEDQDDDQDGPMLREELEESNDGAAAGDSVREVRWSTSTDLGDFVKQSTLGQSFRIVIRPEASGENASTTCSPSDLAPLSIQVLIPSFASRTAYLRRRLLKLTRAIAQSTADKKKLDHEARKGARRFATAGLGGLVAYWGVVCKLTFFSPLGWDVMEPITYLSGLGTVIGGYLFFLYHNREVSYSSVLDLSVSARQQALYAERGLDVESWTEMVSEARQLRREIAKIAADYDYDWRGQLEELEDDVKFAKTRKSTKGEEERHEDAGPAKKKEPTEASPARDSGKLDIDAAIDEASELERATRHERQKRKHGKAGEDEELENRRVRGEKKGKEVAEAG